MSFRKTVRVINACGFTMMCALFGCHRESTPSDLSVLDLSVPRQLDLSEPSYDLSWTACAETKLAGTCVAAFFDSFAACFRPAGHCAEQVSNSFGGCWENGALYNNDPANSNATYRMGKQNCLSRGPTYYDSKQPTQEQYCRPMDVCLSVLTDGGVTKYEGGGIYDLQTGVFTCPDGTKVDIGPDLGGCSVLNELLDPIPLCDNEIHSTQCGSSP